MHKQIKGIGQRYKIRYNRKSFDESLNDLKDPLKRYLCAWMLLGIVAPVVCLFLTCSCLLINSVAGLVYCVHLSTIFFAAVIDGLEQLRMKHYRAENCYQLVLAHQH